MKSLLRFTVIFLFVIFINHQNAYAYLDPGTGSYLLQILLATLLGAAFAIKVFWQKIKISLKKFFSKNTGEGANDPE